MSAWNRAVVALGICVVLAFTSAYRYPHWFAGRIDSLSRDYAPALHGHAPAAIPPNRESLRIAKFVAKREIARQVIARQMSLREAATRFQRVDRRIGESDMVVVHFRGASEGERQCRQVIAWVEGELRQQDQPYSALMELLEVELQNFLRQPGDGGTLNL